MMGLSKAVLLAGLCLVPFSMCHSAAADEAAGQSLVTSDNTQPAVKPVNEKILPMINEGYAALARGESDKAIKVLTRALQVDAESVTARRYLAYAMVRSRAYTSALKQMQELNKLTEPSPFDWYVFGDAYLGAGAVKHALTCYQQSLVLSPGYDAARGGAVKCLAEMGLFSKAMEQVDLGNAQAKDKVVKKYYGALRQGVLDAELYRKESLRTGSTEGVTQQQMEEVGNKPILIGPSSQ